jgi:Spy/CpxP family protein refolding chaperone
MTRRFNPYLAALLAAGSLALAIPAVQAHSSDGPRAERMRGGGEGMRFLRRLDLTEAQREQVKKIFEEQAPNMRSRMEAARTAQQELRALAMSPNFDSGRARELADTAAKAHADAAVMRAEGMSKVFALLTPEQRTRLEERREHRGRR